MNLSVFTEFGRLFKFYLAGAAGLVVETVSLFLLVEIASFNVYFSKLVALELAIISVFLINDRFAFEEFDTKTYALIRTNIVRAAGTLISFIGLYLGLELGFHYLIANTFGVVLATFFNYYFDRLKTWDSV